MVCKSANLCLLALVVLVCVSQALAIRCVVCQNCPEGPFEANLTQECLPESKKAPKPDRCIKMVLRNEEVDRGCGDASKCAGRVIAPPGKKPRSLSKPKSKPEELTNNAPRQRTIRQLLASPEKPGGEGKNVELEVASMFCCDEDECNGGHTLYPFRFHILLALLGIFGQYIHGAAHF